MYQQEKWELRAKAAGKLGLPSAEAVTLVVVTPLVRRTAAVSNRRRERLRARLLLLASRGTATGDGAAPAAGRDLAPPASAEVCGACRGHCCRKGAEHAYLTAKDLGVGPEPLSAAGALELAEIYLSFVPDRAYANSCIYHSTAGCALPRSLRSRTCKTYFCQAMTVLRAGESEPAPTTTLVVFRRFEKTQRTLLLHRQA